MAMEESRLEALPASLRLLSLGALLSFKLECHCRP